jgi:trimethylamine--corrinoid protein Co-methyltransferase
MSQQGYTVKNPINVLSEHEVAAIHQGALDVMENCGLVFQHDKALDILAGAGCSVNREKQLVKFPGHLVEASLKKCPSSFTIKARNPEFDMRVGDPYVFFSAYPAKDRLDLETMEKRSPTLEEYFEDVMVHDSLDQVHWAGYFSGIPRTGGDIIVPGEFILGNVKHSQKAGYLGASSRLVEVILQINNIIGATGLTSVAALPPLTWYTDQIEILFKAAEANFPLKPVSGLTAGANAPATIAGALVQSCAEVMSAIVLAQAFKPGIPIIAQDYSQMLDMRTGSVIQGGVERGLLGAAWCQIWRNYGVPRMTMISSDAKIPDYQCAMEKVMSVTLHAQAGANIITFMGGIYDELTGSPVVTIIDNDVARMIGRFLNGIEISHYTLAVDLIKKVGPIPGHFLNTRHTMESWKKEQLIPDMADRKPYPEWEMQGKKDIIARATEKYRQLVVSYKPMPLPEEEEKEIVQILKLAGML